MTFLISREKGPLSTSPASQQPSCPLVTVLSFQKPSPICHPVEVEGPAVRPSGASHAAGSHKLVILRPVTFRTNRMFSTLHKTVILSEAPRISVA